LLDSITTERHNDVPAINSKILKIMFYIITFNYILEWFF